MARAAGAWFASATQEKEIEGLATLFSHWKFSELEELCLDGNPADRILAIGDATYSSSLRSLVARRCTVAPDVARELSQMTGFLWWQETSWNLTPSL